MAPRISKHYQNRKPSAIRKAQILFDTRFDKNGIDVINLAIGNISLPMHPIMIEALKSLSSNYSPFKNGVVKYTASVGSRNCQDAMIHYINAELKNDISDVVKCVITDGGSQAMELMLLGVCGPSSDNPILFIDPTYTNYIEFCKRLSIPYEIYSRKINDDGSFSEINIDHIRKIINKNKPSGIVIIPGDNPTGQQLSQEKIFDIAKVCVEKDLWLISDEAYRNLYFTDSGQTSIWEINEEILPGILGRRISIESASKIWNACGLRIGSLATDNNSLHSKVVSEYTANLCANAIGQYVFSSILKLSKSEIIYWYKKQKLYYYELMSELRKGLISALPGIIVSNPQTGLYLIIDFKYICDSNFDIENFIEYCATIGKCKIKNKYYTLLLAPMTGFYFDQKDGRTQARIAIVEQKNKLKLVPVILSELINKYFDHIRVN